MDEHITTGQAIIMLSSTRLVLAISTMPTIGLPPYNQDMWFMNVISIIYTLVIFIPLLFLANRFNKFSIGGYIRIIYGKSLGAIIIGLYGLYFLANAVDSMTILAELTTSTMLIQESNMTIVIFIILVIFYIASRGIVTIARALQLLAPVALFITLGLILLGITNADFTLLRPQLSDSSFIDINKGALLLSLFFSDVFIILMIVPQLKKKRDINKITIISVIISMVFLASIVIVVQASLGIEQTRHSNMPLLLYVRLIDAFDLFQRIDSLFVISWIIISLGRNAGFLYISARTFRELFNKTEDDTMILAIASVLLAIVSLFIMNNRSVIGVRKYFDAFYRYLFVAFVIIIPIITCIVYFFRRKTLDKREPSHKLVDKLE